MNAAGLPAVVQRFFTQRLLEQQGLSSHTVASYRDTFQLLLGFATQNFGRAPSKLLMEELDATFMEKFLRHLELNRGNSVRTRNTRLAAVHAFFRFVAISEPALGLRCQRILAIPAKRHKHSPVEFLTEEEATALAQGKIRDAAHAEARGGHEPVAAWSGPLTPRPYAQPRSPSRLNALRPHPTAILFLHVDSSSCRSRHSQRAPFAMEGGFKLALTLLLPPTSTMSGNSGRAKHGFQLDHIGAPLGRNNRRERMGIAIAAHVKQQQKQ